MRTPLLILLALFVFRIGISQNDTLNLNYFVEAPFAYTDNGQLNGIEIELMNEYAQWLKAKKNISVTIKHNSFTDYKTFFNSVKSGNKTTIGLGAVTINSLTAKEVDFTKGYLKHVAFCITNGNAPDIKVKTAADIVKTLGNMTGLTIPNSNLSVYVNEIKKTYVNDLKIKEMAEQIKILDEIARNILTFGFVDAVEFWFYLKNNPQKFLKMQKPLNQSKEELGFILPKGSQHKALFNEFFSAPGGFKSSKNYRAILEKYMGSYMTQNMAVN